MFFRLFLTLLCLGLPSVALASDVPLSIILATTNAPQLIALGLILVLLEFALPTKGTLGLIGAFLFVVGTSSLPNNPVESLRISWTMVVLMNILVLGTLAAIAYITLHGYSRNDIKTTQPYIGQTGRIIEWNDTSKRVDFDGAVWLAATRTHEHYKPGDAVIIVAQDNLTLYVSRQGETS
jgi:membrane-bound ClpP family serine protease